MIMDLDFLIALRSTFHRLFFLLILILYYYLFMYIDISYMKIGQLINY